MSRQRDEWKNPPHSVNNSVDSVIFMESFSGTNTGSRVVFVKDFDGTNFGNHCEFRGDFRGKNLGMFCVFLKGAPQEEKSGAPPIDREYFIALPEKKRARLLTHGDLDRLSEDCHSNQRE